MGLRHLKTSETLLCRARDWADSQAWNEMFQRYDPLLQRWSRKYLENHADVAEVNQRVWIELAHRIILFRYAPGKSFRSWLKTLHRSRVADFLKSRSREWKRYETFSRELSQSHASDETTATQESGTGRLEEFQARMMQIQGRVQGRVKERTWQIFWSIAIDQRSISETANAFEMSYTATFAAFRRVEKQLRAEALKDQEQR